MLQPIIPNESRSTALDPELLTAEISLLLDALSRYFPIDERVRGGEVLEPPDLQFLLELRDFLNSRAEPATGASIAFTTLVIRRLPEARKGKADAERACPEWVPMARALSRTMVGL